MRNNTVDGDLEKSKRSCGGADAAWIEYLVATNGDASAVCILRVGLDLVYYFGVGDFVSAAGRDVLVVNDEEGIGARDTPEFVIGVSSNALAQAAKFVGVGSVPGVRVVGVLVDLAVLE